MEGSHMSDELRDYLDELKVRYAEREKNMIAIQKDMDAVRESIYDTVRQVILDEGLLSKLKWKFNYWDRAWMCIVAYGDTKAIADILAIAGIGGYHYGFTIDKADKVEYRDDDDEITLMIKPDANIIQKWLTRLNIKVDISGAEKDLAELELRTGHLRNVVHDLANYKGGNK
jgi:hypothetical protein